MWVPGGWGVPAELGGLARAERPREELWRPLVASRPPSRGPGLGLRAAHGAGPGRGAEGGGTRCGPCRLGPGPSPPRPPLLGGSQPGRREAELREVEGGERVRSRQVTSEPGAGRGRERVGSLFLAHL